MNFLIKLLLFFALSFAGIAIWMAMKDFGGPRLTMLLLAISVLITFVGMLFSILYLSFRKKKKPFIFPAINLIFGLTLIGSAVFLYTEVKDLAFIHDVTTDVVEVPSFQKALPVAIAQEGMDYLSNPPTKERIYDPRNAAKQEAAYPSIKPYPTQLPQTVAFAVVKQIVASNPDWKVLFEDIPGTHIELAEKFGFFHFVDDLIVEVRTNEGMAGSVLQLRSRSRLGSFDFGKNARRISGFINEFRKLESVALKKWQTQINAISNSENTQNIESLQNENTQPVDGTSSALSRKKQN